MQTDSRPSGKQQGPRTLSSASGGYKTSAFLWPLFGGERSGVPSQNGRSSIADLDFATFWGHFRALRCLKRLIRYTPHREQRRESICPWWPRPEALAMPGAPAGPASAANSSAPRTGTGPHQLSGRCATLKDKLRTQIHRHREPAKHE